MHDLSPSWSGAWTRACEVLAQPRRLALLTHVRPDGDAYGSLLALGLALEARGHEVRLFNEDGLSEKYAFLPGSARIQTPPATPPPCELLVALDNANAERLGATFAGWGRPVWLNLDHHASNQRYGEINIVADTVPATGQLLFELFQQAGWTLTPDIAANLFIAISTDTGSFRYRGTTQRSFEVAAALTAAGADPAELARQCYSSHPLRRLRLQQAVLAAMAFAAGGRIAHYALTRRMYAETGARPEDTEGLVESIISTQGVDLAIVFEEREDASIKMSFRAKGALNVNELAAVFQGGGHREAAGAQQPGPLEEVRARVLGEAERRLASGASTQL